jgi:DNA topoisomerase-3
MMPDFEYRQTVVTMRVPVPDAKDAEFRATGRIPLVEGWKAVFGGGDPEAAKETEQTLPALADGESAVLQEPKVEARRTMPPPRYNEGTLIDAMQNAWRFVEDKAMRDRLKEAKGIGTPATRAEIIKGLKRQNMLAADGKLVVPTDAGLQLFELLRDAAPALVDPGTTAQWEMYLDAVVTGNTNFRSVIDGIAAEAGKMIAVLRQRPRGGVDLQAQPLVKTARGKRASGKARSPSKGRSAPKTPRQAVPAKAKKPGKSRTSDIASQDDTVDGARRTRTPTERMVSYARKLAKTKGLDLPPDYRLDFKTCRRFLDQHG